MRKKVDCFVPRNDAKRVKRMVKIVVGKHQGEPTCDNCGMMAFRNFRDVSTHRHCDLMGLYIPDYEMFPTCELHTWMNATSRRLASKKLKWETTTVKEGGAA